MTTAKKLKITTLMIFRRTLLLYLTLVLNLPPTRITYVTFVRAQSELKLVLYLVGTPDSVKHALTDVSHLIIGSARCAEQELILWCLFLISFYLNVLLFLWYEWQCSLICDRELLPFLLHAVSITYSFLYVPFQWPLYPPSPLHAVYSPLTVTCRFLYMRIPFD